MSNVQQGRYRRGGRQFLAIGLLATLLASCSRSGSIQVSASASPSSPVTALRQEVSTFQGSVAAIDLIRNGLLVAVEIDWTPVLKAGRGERLVTVGPQTRWEPLGNSLASVRTGDQVQVEALPTAAGGWLAQKVSLFDID